MKTKYIIKINGQTLTRNSKRSDFTHAVIGRAWSGCENEEADAPTCKTQKIICVDGL